MWYLFKYFHLNNNEVDQFSQYEKNINTEQLKILHCLIK